MRKTSLAMLGAAAALLLVAAIAAGRAGAGYSGVMDRAGALRVLDQGREALAHRDVGGIMALIAPDAKALGMNPDQMQAALTQAMDEMGSDHLTAEVQNPEFTQTPSRAEVTFFLDVKERKDGADILYYHTRMHATLARTSVARWMGLLRSEEWRIVELDADPPIDIPRQ